MQAARTIDPVRPHPFTRSSMKWKARQVRRDPRRWMQGALMMARKRQQRQEE